MELFPRRKPYGSKTLLRKEIPKENGELANDCIEGNQSQGSQNSLRGAPYEDEIIKGPLLSIKKEMVQPSGDQTSTRKEALKNDEDVERPQPQPLLAFLGGDFTKKRSLESFINNQV